MEPFTKKTTLLDELLEKFNRNNERDKQLIPPRGRRRKEQKK